LYHPLLLHPLIHLLHIFHSVHCFVDLLKIFHFFVLLEFWVLIWSWKNDRSYLTFRWISWTTLREDHQMFDVYDLALKGKLAPWNSFPSTGKRWCFGISYKLRIKIFRMNRKQ
jgi:hypothetical protein